MVHHHSQAQGRLLKGCREALADWEPDGMHLGITKHFAYSAPGHKLDVASCSCVVIVEPETHSALQSALAQNENGFRATSSYS